jgi:soluble cytochrome b562
MIRNVAVDDVDYGTSGVLTEADTAVYIGKNGQWYELHVTDQHAEIVDKHLDEFLRFARPIDGQPPRTKRVNVPDKKQTVGYYRGMRLWADQHDRSDEYHKIEGKSSGAHQSYKYRDSLRQDYAAYVAMQNAVG